MAAVCVPSSLKGLFVLHLVTHKETLLCREQWWVHSSQMKSRRQSLLYRDKHTHARARSHACAHTHTHTHACAHTQQLKTEVHSAAYISSYRSQHHSQVPGNVVYDMFIIKGKYCEWCNTTVLHCISVNNSQRMWIHPTGIVALTVKIHVPGYLFTILNFYLCGYKWVGVIGSQAWDELLWHTMDDTALKLNSDENKQKATQSENRLLLCTRSCWTVRHLIMYSVITYVKHNYTTKVMIMSMTHVCVMSLTQNKPVNKCIKFGRLS
jgi:hypothetical protein